jgi:hypothetical protein
MHSTNRRHLIVVSLALVLSCSGVWAAQKANGPVHTRYVAELVERLVTTPQGTDPVILTGAVAGDAAHHRALHLRFHNNTEKAIAGFSWQWTWDSEQCPGLKYVRAAPDSYDATLAAGTDADVYVSPDTVRDLLRTTKKRCHNGPSVKLTLRSVRFVDGSQWEAPKPPASSK